MTHQLHFIGPGQSKGSGCIASLEGTMIPSVFNLSQHSIRSIWLPVTCILVAFSSHKVHAATPNVNELLANAERGSVDQEIKLAEAYLTGNGVAKNPELATHGYEKAAQSGNPEAQNLVGQFYQDGVGVPVDPVRAFHWYQLAAASGSSDAFLTWGWHTLWDSE
jgi:TPR repeat protein